MERINPFDFYEIGKGLRAVFGIREDALTVDALWPLMDCKNAIHRVLNSEFNISFSHPEATNISNRLSAVLAKYYEREDENGNRFFSYPEKDERIRPWELSGLRTEIEAFEKVYGAELRGAATYFVPKRGIFSVPTLIDSADQTFPAELSSFIPSKTREEWRAAGRCLAFNLLSASGFHVARGVEGMLEAYHQTFCPAGRRGLKLWKDYLEDFRSCLAGTTQASPSRRVTTALEQMKDDYRNPLMHPRVVLEEPDARMLMANGESLIILMAQEIQVAFHTGAVKALAILSERK